jgi:alpha-L-fucosidase
VSPDRRGLLPETDVAVLEEVWRIVTETFKNNLAEGKPATASNVRGGDATFAAAKAVDGDSATYWCIDDGVTAATLTIDLGAPTTFNRSMVQEHIALGQRVENYTLEALVDGEWQPIIEGTTIGHKRLDRFDDVTATQVRLTIAHSLACPTIRAFGLYRAAE